MPRRLRRSTGRARRVALFVRCVTFEMWRCSTRRRPRSSAEGRRQAVLRPPRTARRTRCTHTRAVRCDRVRRVSDSAKAPTLGDRSRQQGASGGVSCEQGTCPWLCGRNAGAPAHHRGPAVGEGAHDTAHVLSGRGRPGGDRIERRCGPTARLVAQSATDAARGRRDRGRQAGRHGQGGVGAGTRAALGRDHGDVRRLRALPGKDDATDTGRPSHTRRPAGRAVNPSPTLATAGAHASARDRVLTTPPSAAPRIALEG